MFFHDLIKSENLLANRNLKAFFSSLTLVPLLLLSYHQVLFLKMTPFEISKKKYGDQFIKSYEIAQAVKKLTDPSHKIYEWGAETGIYYYSKRSSVTDIFYIYPLLRGPKEERLKKAQKVYDHVILGKPELFIYNKYYGKSFFSDFLQKKYNLEKRMGAYSIFRIKDKQHSG